MLCSQICKTAICSLFYSYCKVDFCFSIQNLRICKSKVFIYSRIVSLSATSFCIFTALKIIGILWKRKKIAVFEALPLECIRPCIQKYTCKFILFISFKDVFFFTSCWTINCVLAPLYSVCWICNEHGNNAGLFCVMHVGCYM